MEKSSGENKVVSGDPIKVISETKQDDVVLRHDPAKIQKAKDHVYECAMSSDSLAYFYSRKMPERGIGGWPKDAYSPDYDIHFLSEAPQETGTILDIKTLYIEYNLAGFFSYRTKLSDEKSGGEVMSIFCAEIRDSIGTKLKSKIAKGEALSLLESFEKRTASNTELKKEKAKLRSIATSTYFLRLLAEREHVLTFIPNDPQFKAHHYYYRMAIQTRAYASFFELGNVVPEIETIYNLAKKTPEEVSQLLETLFACEGYTAYQSKKKSGSIYDPVPLHTWTVNAAWVSGLIIKGRSIKVYSAPTEANMWRSNPAMGKEEYSAFAKEITGLLQADYEFNVEKSNEERHVIFSPSQCKQKSNDREELENNLNNISSQSVLEGISNYRKIYLQNFKAIDLSSLIELIKTKDFKEDVGNDLLELSSELVSVFNRLNTMPDREEIKEVLCSWLASELALKVHTEPFQNNELMLSLKNLKIPTDENQIVNSIFETISSNVASNSAKAEEVVELLTTLSITETSSETETSIAKEWFKTKPQQTSSGDNAKQSASELDSSNSSRSMS